VTVVVQDAAGNGLGEHTVSLQPAKKGRMPRAPQEKWQNMFAALEERGARQRAQVGETAELNNLWPRAAEAYTAALQADAQCKEALAGLGFVALRNARFEEAKGYAERLEAAGGKAVAAYLLGAAELLAGRADEAVSALKKATRDAKVGPMARLLLAMAQARAGQVAQASKTAEQLPEPTASMPVALWVKAALAGDAWAEDPTSGWTVGDEAELLDLACERAVWAIRVGMPALGERVLENLQRQGARGRGQGTADINGNDRQFVNASGMNKEPLVWYLKGYLQHLQGKEAAAKESLGRASELARNNKLPSYPEWVAVLHWVLETNPADAKPQAYLAPLEYWLGRKDEAIQHWQDMVRADGDADSSMHYGLAMALWEARADRPSAAKTLAEALSANPKEERLYLVLDDVLVEAQDIETRGWWLEKARANCGQTDSIVERYCHWLINQQRWNEVADLLTSHKFGPSHGLYIRRRMWLLAHHQLALKCLRSEDYAKAYEYGVAGATPPSSLGEDDMTMPFASPVLLAAAQACERMGDARKAKDLCRQALKAAESGHMHPPYSEIHRARVLLKLGKKKAAEKLLKEVLNEVLPRLEDVRPDLNKGHFHYLYGLVLETQGQQEEAKQQFGEAERLKMQWANLVGYGVQWGFN